MKGLAILKYKILRKKRIAFFNELAKIYGGRDCRENVKMNIRQPEIYQISLKKEIQFNDNSLRYIKAYYYIFETIQYTMV